MSASFDDQSELSLSSHYLRIRRQTEALCATLQPEDMAIQTMPDVSPAKWHLAHTTWFFEAFLLKPYLEGYQVFDETFHYLFNSYYVTAGSMHPRPLRGQLSRPVLQQVLDYRQHVDVAMEKLLVRYAPGSDIAQRTTLGIHHEQQHQELLLTDIKHVFSCNPLSPVMDPALKVPAVHALSEMCFGRYEGGIQQIGIDQGGFFFDNETPRHDVLLRDFEIGERLITNGEFRAFIKAGGYRDPALWLSDGWAAIHQQGWNRPLYWDEDLHCEFTLGGIREINEHAPVAHVSYYEADAYARWAGCRLPTEAEWEFAAQDREIEGNFQESGYWHPVPAANGRSQMFGDVWEWTASPYAPYPGFKPLDGTLGEYNGKFMCNQVTVRGGSCATARDHVRASYRSFFYPDARWQFLGFRLARDAG